MLTVNFILGKRQREEIKPLITESGTPLSRSETTPYRRPENVHYYANAKQFSYRTERDNTQAVGKLYTGSVDDE